MGGNPQASQGSLLACPDILGEIERIRERGGKVVVVDPRRTGTADKADEWIPIVPGTDAAFLLAICQRAVRRRARRPRRPSPTSSTASTTCAHSPPTSRPSASPARAGSRPRRSGASRTRSPPRRRAAVYGRIGLCNQEFGTLASWLIDVVNILTGNFDRPGGLMFGNPVAWGANSLPDPQWADGVTFGRWKSRVRGAPEVLGQVPVSCLAEEIATPGDGQLKALVTIAGNPVISAPDAGRLDAALPMLECMISVDNYLNETTRHAHVILPGLSALEQPHFDDLIWMWAARSAGNFSPAVFPPPADRPAEWEILTRLAGAARRHAATPTSTSPRSTTATSPRSCEAKGVDADEP